NTSETYGPYSGCDAITPNRLWLMQPHNCGGIEYHGNPIYIIVLFVERLPCLVGVRRAARALFL
ncbi:MAG: hypothetical protein ABJ059_18865, partial [Hyphomicrobiales bacterium]